MDKLEIAPPVVQVAIDVKTIGEALHVAEAAVKAGVDWLEIGTPLVTFAGTSAIGAVAREFPGVPVLADYKMMDGVAKYVHETAAQGGRICTICAVASDASIRTAVRAAQEDGIVLISDLYAAPDVPGRAVQLAEMGLDSVYIHLGADQRTEDPTRDPLMFLEAVKAAVNVPVGVGTFSAEEGERACRLGADIVVIGVPVIQAPNVEAALREYVERAKAAR
jgi:3-hexulose-6-phosphate synthase/6-phospho-3-hexuloisomerase